MNITERDLNKSELLIFLNESSVSVAIEADGKFKAANHYFYELTGYTGEGLAGRSIDTFFDEDSLKEVNTYKSRIIDNITNKQIIRNEDKRLSVILKCVDGRQIGVMMAVVLLSHKPIQKWGYKLIEQSLFHQDPKHVEKIQKLKDYLLNISQSL